jgi:hypothetical protein
MGYGEDFLPSCSITTLFINNLLAFNGHPESFAIYFQQPSRFVRNILNFGHDLQACFKKSYDRSFAQPADLNYIIVL